MGAETAVKDTTWGLSPDTLKDIQKFTKALKEAVSAACDELIAAAEAARAAYMAARQEAEPTIDAIMALFGEMEDAGEPRQRGGGIPCPRPSRRLWPAERPPGGKCRAQYIKRIRPCARSTIKQYRNRRKP